MKPEYININNMVEKLTSVGIIKQVHGDIKFACPKAKIILLNCCSSKLRGSVLF